MTEETTSPRTRKVLSSDQVVLHTIGLLSSESSQKYFESLPADEMTLSNLKGLVDIITNNEKLLSKSIKSAFIQQNITSIKDITALEAFEVEIIDVIKKAKENLSNEEVKKKIMQEKVSELESLTKFSDDEKSRLIDYFCQNNNAAVVKNLLSDT